MLVKNFEYLLQQIKENLDIQKLYLGQTSNNKDFEVTAQLFFTPKNSEVFEFSFKHKDEIILLFESLKNTKILYLDMRAIGLGDAEAILLASVLPNTQITSLDLSDNDLGKIGIKAIADALKNTYITDLELQGHQLQGNLIEGIPIILKDSKITFLDLSHHKIGKETITLLTECLKYSAIRSLALYNTQMQDDEFAILASVLPSTGIKELYVASNDIGDNGINIFTKILNDTKLNLVYLGGNKIGNNGGAQLSAALTENYLITTIKIEGNLIDTQILNDIKSTLQRNVTLVEKLAFYINSENRAYNNENFIENLKLIFTFYHNADKYLLSKKLEELAPDIDPKVTYQNIESYIENHCPCVFKESENLQQDLALIFGNPSFYFDNA